MGKINDIVGNLSNSPSDLFSGSQVQLNHFASVALKNADYSRIRLDGGFFLGEQTGTSARHDHNSEKKCETFHDQLVLPHSASKGQQIKTENGVHSPPPLI